MFNVTSHSRKLAWHCRSNPGIKSLNDLSILSILMLFHWETGKMGLLEPKVSLGVWKEGPMRTSEEQSGRRGGSVQKARLLHCAAFFPASLSSFPKSFPPTFPLICSCPHLNKAPVLVKSRAPKALQPYPALLSHWKHSERAACSPEEAVLGSSPLTLSPPFTVLSFFLPLPFLLPSTVEMMRIKPSELKPHGGSFLCLSLPPSLSPSFPQTATAFSYSTFSASPL